MEPARSAQRQASRTWPLCPSIDHWPGLNRSVKDVSGELLLVPQFTLAADTRKGTRAGFSTAAEPQVGQRLFEAFVARCSELVARVATGRFGAHMRVSSTNDGPVTFWLQVAPSIPRT